VSDGSELLRHLDLKHLRQLMEVAEKGSIRAAADALAITQPALSRSIRAMETELGAKLVERSASGTALTSAGDTLLKYARIMDANLILAQKELRGLQDQSRSIEQIGIGMSWLAESLVAPPLVENVVQNKPNVRLKTMIGDFESLAPALMSGKIEFFVGPPPLQNPTIGIATRSLAEFPAGILVRSEHPLARKQQISVAELARGQWILPLAGTMPRIVYDNFFLRHGTAPPAPVLEVEPLSPIIRHLLLNRNFMTILPLVVADQDVEAGLLKVLPFGDTIVFTMHVTRRQMGYQSAACQYVMSEIERLARAISARSSVANVDY
jgi:DNA-binding transcriptional LysR family regulator